MSNGFSFDKYTEDRKDGPTFPAPPAHEQEVAPPADDVLAERVEAAEQEGRWGDALALKLRNPEPVQQEDDDGQTDAEAPEESVEWGIAQWEDKSGFFDPPPSRIVSDRNDDGQDAQDNDANDDSNDGEEAA